MLFFYFSVKRRIILSSQKQNKTVNLLQHIMQGVRLFRSSPETASGVTQQHGGLELDFVFVAVRDAAPARVGDDDRVGQRGQSVADDGHLHRVT